MRKWFYNQLTLKRVELLCRMHEQLRVQYSLPPKTYCYDLAVLAVAVTGMKLAITDSLRDYFA